MLRISALLLGATIATSAANLDRRLYVTDKTGISVYDIDNGHKLLRKIDLPGPATTKASPPARSSASSTSARTKTTNSSVST